MLVSAVGVLTAVLLSHSPRLRATQPGLDRPRSVTHNCDAALMAAARAQQ